MTKRAPIRTAFINIPRRLWAGGHNYQHNLFEVLNRHQPGDIAPVLFAGMNDGADEIASLAGLPGVEIVRSPAFDHANKGLLSALALGIDWPAAAQFREQHIDLVFESARFFGWRLPLPTIAWFPDFQHRRLPHLFSRAARLRRDLGFRAQMASGRHIMLSSASALRDLRELYREPANGVSVVRFAAEPPRAFLTANPFNVVAQYDLPARYLYLPNQFWRHKNHRVVIDALAILKRRGSNVVVAASGNTQDLREPDYFEAVMRDVKTRGLDASFRHLGVIPREHVYALLRVSAALINPSEFEGWSTTVEEAKSFGAPMILSDIDVHREQAGETARYFGTNDAQALANHMMEVLELGAPVAARDLQSGAEERVKVFSADFVQLARDITKS